MTVADRKKTVSYYAITVWMMKRTVSMAKLTVLEANMTVFENKVTVLKAKVTVLKAKMTVLEHKLTVLKAKVTVLEDFTMDVFCIFSVRKALKYMYLCQYSTKNPFRRVIPAFAGMTLMSAPLLRDSASPCENSEDHDANLICISVPQSS